MIEIMAEVLVYMALSFVVSFIAGLISRWGKQKMPATVQVEMSDTDKEMIQKSQELIQECFGDDVVGRLRNASNIDRINMMSDFSKRLAELYGLDIDVDVVVEDYRKQGSYNWGQQKAVFNIVLLTLEGNDESFEWAVKQSLDTIIHELRHAVQHKAIKEEGFWNVDEERRAAWANNVTNYINPQVDFEGYTKQPIEADAATFAAQVLNEVD